MTGYVVHYSDGTTVGTKSVAASSNSSDITNLINGLIYNFSVEATSDQLSGESDSVTVILCEFHYNIIIYLRMKCSCHVMVL